MGKAKRAHHPLHHRNIIAKTLPKWFYATTYMVSCFISMDHDGGFMEYRRNYRPGGIYFFTVVTANRKPLLIDNIERLRASFRHAKTKYPFEIEAAVILPDHLHMIWQLPENDSDFSTRWMVIKRFFSSAIKTQTISSSKARKREKGIWQRRFWEHLIRDEDDFRKHMDYIHFNPVKHGLVEKPEEWPYSSYQKALACGWYEKSPIVPIPSIQGYHE